jgi:transcriptional regulator with XRE-family HTH domain
LNSITTYTVKQHIGKLIKQHRLEQKLTQQELATLIGADRQYIWNLENGRINLSLNYLDKIILKLKCTHNDFFRPIINNK